MPGCQRDDLLNKANPKLFKQKMNHNSEFQICKSQYSTAHRIVFLFFLIAGLAIYSNTFDVPPQYDDGGVFAHQSIDDMLDRCKLSNWRVIAQVTFTFNHWLSGTDVWSYHIFNLIVHVCTAFLVYQLLFQIMLLTDRAEKVPACGCSNDLSSPTLPPSSDTIFWASFLGALFFLVHPLTTQAVTYIARRYNSLAALFYVASVVCYLKARYIVWMRQGESSAVPFVDIFFNLRHLCWYSLSFGAAVLAMLTKEISITLPVVLVLIEFLLVQCDLKDVRRRVIYLLPLLATIFIIPYYHLVVHSDYLERTARKKFLPIGAEEKYLSRRVYFFSQLGIIWSIYLRLLVLPLGQNVEHDFFVSDGLCHPTTLGAFIGLICLLSIAALIVKRHRLLAFGIFWFIVTISVSSSIFTSKILVAEHRVYLPMVGLAFVIAGIYRYIKRPRRFWVVIVPIMLILSTLTFMRNSLWKDKLTLWGDALKKSPGMGRPHNNYAAALHKAGRLDEAIAICEKVLAMPDKPYKMSDT